MEDKFRIKLAGMESDDNAGTPAWQRALQLGAEMRRN